MLSLESVYSEGRQSQARWFIERLCYLCIGGFRLALGGD